MTLWEGLLCLWGSAHRALAPPHSEVSPAAHLPRETRATLSIIFHVPRSQHSGPEEALTVLVAPAYLVTSFGKLLCRTRHTAVVIVFGAVSAGLAGEAEDRRIQVTTEACTMTCWRWPPLAAHPTAIVKSYLPRVFL